MATKEQMNVLAKWALHKLTEIDYKVHNLSFSILLMFGHDGNFIDIVVGDVSIQKDNTSLLLFEAGSISDHIEKLSELISAIESDNYNTVLNITETHRATNTTPS